MTLKTVDWTTGKLVIHDGNKDNVLTKSEFFDWIGTLSKNTLLVGEYAHFGCPRRGMSRAQPYLENELHKLREHCEKHNVNFKLFPQMSTQRALNTYKIKKASSSAQPDRDAEAIYKFVTDYPQTSLMNFPVTFNEDKNRKEGYRYITTLNKVLNLVRGDDKKGYMQKDDGIFQFLQENIENIIEKLSPETKSAFGLTDDSRYKKTGKINFNNVKMPQVYSILAIMLDHDGNHRVRNDTKKLPGWKFAKKYIIRMSPYHLKGGLLRSNIYWHGLKNWVSAQAANELNMTKKDFKGLYRGGYCNDDGKFVKKMTPQQDQCYLKYRRQYCKAVKELYCTFKRKLEK